jgi:hypothetical protein
VDRKLPTVRVCMVILLGISCADGSAVPSDSGTGGSSTSTEEPPSEDNCFPPSNLAAINLGCGSSDSPMVTIAGPCTLSSGGEPQIVYLQNHDAGICHVEFLFESGATSFVDLNITTIWRPLGSDARGCGPEFVAISDQGSPCRPSACQFSLPERSCDGGP